MMINPGNETSGINTRSTDVGNSRVNARPLAASPTSGQKASDSTAHEPVSLSAQARNMLKLEQEIRNQSGVRDKKVAELRNMIDGGQYSINPQKIAANMLKADEWF